MLALLELVKPTSFIRHWFYSWSGLHSVKLANQQLMTKFHKAEKTECFGFLFWIVWFWQFQTQTKE
jgi:hypothetical protein